jgi:hypothetical protein
MKRTRKGWKKKKQNKRMINKRMWVVSADIASARSVLFQVYTPLNAVTKLNLKQTSGIIIAKINNQSSSSVSWQDLKLGSVPVHNHAQFSNVCAVTQEICDDCAHGWSNLDHPATQNETFSDIFSMPHLLCICTANEHTLLNRKHVSDAMTCSTWQISHNWAKELICNIVMMT